MDIYTKPMGDFIKESKIPIRILESETAIYMEMAEITADIIIRNNDKKTVVICPVGPIGQYPYLAQIINSKKINLKNVWFINMDEYLDDSGNIIDYNHRLSFHKAMDEQFYNNMDPDLLMPKEQRSFPEPGREEAMDSLLDGFETIHCVLTSVGINGHIAFNEPPKEAERTSDAEFINTGTRCLDIAKETIVNNGSRKLGGALDLFPKRCITLGMKHILKAEMIKIYLYCDWHWGIMRKIALGEETPSVPASYLQSHKNSEMVITRALAEFIL